MSWKRHRSSFTHFDAILGSVDRSCALDFNALGVPSIDLVGLDLFLRARDLKCDPRYAP
jgi:hypothetical protein